MKNSILFITGDKEIMQYVYKTYNFGYWSSCFDIILEKHGFLDYDKATQEILDNPEELRKYDLLIISWLPTKFWKMSYLRSLKAYDGLIFIEGPYPKFLEPFLGIKKYTSKKFLKKSFQIEENIKRWIYQKFKGIVEENYQTKIAPKKVLTKKIELSKQELLEKDSEDRLQNILLSLFVSYKNRYIKHKKFFKNPEYNALTVLAFAMFIEKIKDPNFKKSSLEFLIKVLKDQPQYKFTLENQKILASLILLTITSRILDKYQVHSPHFLKDEEIEKIKTYLKSEENIRLISYLGICQTIFKKKYENIYKEKLIKYIIEDPIALYAFSYFQEDKNYLKEFLSNISFDELFKNKTIWQILLMLASLKNLGIKETKKWLDQIFEECFDFKKGSFSNAKYVNNKLQIETGYCILPWIFIALLEFVSEINFKETTSEISKQFLPEQIIAWENPPYWIEAYENIGGDNKAYFVINEKTFPLLFKRGRILGSTFQILSYLVHFYTMHPLKEAFFDCQTKDLLVLEYLLFHLIKTHLIEYGYSFLNVNHWPYNKKYCLTIRHDVDRIPSEEVFNTLINYEKENNLGVSWYWIPTRINEKYINIQERLKHEVGLHAMKLTEKEKEISKINRYLTSQKVYGETYHGGGGGDYWLGFPSVLKAKEVKLLYTEGVPTIYDLPYYGFPFLDQKGSIEKIPIVLLSHSTSVDHHVRKKSAFYKKKFLKFLASNSFYICLLNHPDINFETLKEWINELPLERINWSCKEVAEWWQATHNKNSLNFKKIEDTKEKVTYEITSRNKINDLQVNFFIPQDFYQNDIKVEINNNMKIDFECENFLSAKLIKIKLNLEPNTSSKLTIHRKRTPKYEEVYNCVPNNMSGPNVKPNYHLPRISNMVQVINLYTEYKNLNKRVTIADIGCGYGPFTIALHLLEQPLKSIGLDLSAKYIETAQSIVNKLELRDIDFIQADMRDTDKFIKNIDIAIVNNSINFLSTRKDYKKALKSFYEVLRPGGALIILTPNKLYYKEAFTQLIGVQFMPKFLANWYVKFRKRRETYEDIRLPSPFELKRWLKKTGFKEIKVIDAYTLLDKNWKRYFKPRFYLVAIK